jgi:hypothetical protein
MNDQKPTKKGKSSKKIMEKAYLNSNAGFPDLFCLKS